MHPNHPAHNHGGPPIVAMIIPLIFVLILATFMLVTMWKVFTKAGEPGWAILVPIYNTITLLKIAGKPWWWMFGFFIPVVSIITHFVVAIGLAERFGKSAAFGIGLVFLGPIFYPILAFGSATYGGAAPAQGGIAPNYSPGWPAS